MRPTHSGAEVHRIGPGSPVYSDNRLRTAERSFDQDVEIGKGQPDKTLSQVIARGGSTIAVSITGMGNESGSGVPMGHQVATQDHAQRKIRLQADTAYPTTQMRIPHRQHQGEARTEGETRVAVADELITIVE